ncbi:uncharacterized protein LOC122870239 isoform X2 [Siniperca chuatsi]|uniref:uncharacterized protein LOC122870239 isoform X2 n=1 Tax=Siniperca chuatsi TaxID=119488 RepID=UPI001CE1574C|nr:uncharacterized protein LOC122870239 isoform X2 [Siniperca chuatsi]
MISSVATKRGVESLVLFDANFSEVVLQHSSFSSPSSSGLHLQTVDMSLNSSSPSNSSLGSVPLNCSSSNVSFLIGSAFIVTKAFLLIPLSILILYLGHQRWRRQHSFTTTSHSDIFTYHMAAIELIGGLGSAFFFCGSSVDLPQMVIAGYCLSFINFCGENFFHLLTCVERYLAVVHPVTYLGLRNIHWRTYISQHAL